MATDWWPSQEGRIADGLTLNCIAEGAIVEGSAVKFGTSTSGQITVAAGAALGDSWGVAVKAAAAAGDPVPILVYGLYKMTVDNGTGQPVQGEFVMNSLTTTVTSTEDCGFTASTSAAMTTTGGSYLLGMAMQSATADADELVIFIGKSP